MNWMLLVLSEVMTFVMNVEFLDTTIGSFLQMNLAEGLTYLCENITVFQAIIFSSIALIAFRILRTTIRLIHQVLNALCQLLRLADAYLRSKQEDLFPAVFSPKTIFNPGTPGVKWEPSKSSSTFETAATASKNSSVKTIQPLV